MSWYFTLLSQIYFRIKRIIIRQVFATLDNRNYIDNSNGKRWDRFYISSIFRETVKIHFHEISNFLKPYVIYKIINSTKYIPRTISQSNFLHLETFTDTRCSNGQPVFKMEIYILPETPRAIASTSSRLDEGIDHYHAREDRWRFPNL